MNGSEFWDLKYRRDGHTGYGDSCLYRYDQPIRMRAFDGEIGRVLREVKIDRCLDIGCGTGDVVELLAKRGLNVTGVDISQEAIAHAAARFSGTPDVCFRRVDVAMGELGAQKFDLITSVTVLQHSPDDDALRSALKRLRSALTQKGRILALEIAPLLPRTITRTRRGVTERTDSEWRLFFRDCGLNVRSVKPYAPIGPLALNVFNRMIGRLIRDRTSDAALSPDTIEAPQGTPIYVSKLRRIAQSTTTVARKLLLTGCWPLDNLLRLRMPGRFAYYRIYELSCANSEQVTLRTGERL